MAEFERYQFEILKTCEEIHMFCNGSSDVISVLDATERVTFLERRLSDWKPPESNYDIIVRGLVRQTLLEWSDWCLEQCKDIPRG